jgi:hypothetical protein
MGNRKPLTDDEGEVREWTEADFAAAKKFSELPEMHQRVLKGIMAQREKKRRVSIPLSPAVVKKGKRRRIAS